MSKLRSDIKISGRGARYILDDNKIIELFKQGRTIEQIASDFKVSRPTINRRLRQYGIKREKKYTLDENIFSTFTPESCYWAGFVAADGWVGSNHKKKKICINLAIKDIAHLQKMSIFMGRAKEAVRNKSSGYFGKRLDQCVLEVGNKQIVLDLVSNFNVVQAKSLTLLPPINIPIDLAKHYIRGYFDGDGCISWDNKSNIMKFNIVSASPNILPWIVDYIKKETKNKLNIYFGKDNIYRIQTSGSKAQAIFNWLYKDSTQETRLDRKYERYQNYLQK